MKRKNQMLAVLLTAVLSTGCLAACGDKQDTGSDAAIQDSQKSNSQSKDVQNTSSQETSDQAEDSILNEPGVFPISKEKITLTIGVTQSDVIEDWKTNALTKELEDKVGVNLEFEIFPAEDAVSKISARVAADTGLPDIMVVGNLENYYNDTGVFLPVTDWYNDPDMAYYFNKRVADDPDKKDFLLRSVAAPDGEIYGCFRYQPEIGNEYSYRMWINKTWLDALGLPIPTTTEEYYETLKAFVEKDPNGNGKKDEIGLIGSTNGWHRKPQESLMNAFTYVDPTHNYLTVEDDGSLSVSYIKDGYRQGLEYMHRLVEEGLLSPLSFTQTTEQLCVILEDPDYQLVGSLVAGSLSVYETDSIRKRDFVPLPPLTGPGGTCYATYNPSLPDVTCYITKYCEHPEVAFRLLDYMYDETMSMWVRFGIPEVDWTTDVAGLKGLYEDSLGVPCGFRQINDVTGANNSRWPNQLLPCYRDNLDSLSIQGLAVPDDPYDYALFTATAIPYYTDKHPEHIIEKLVYTQDELDAIGDIATSLETYRSESVARFIVGDMPLSEWDSYVKEIETIGLETYLDITQQAYDRANSN